MGCMRVPLCPKTVLPPGPEVRVLPGQPAGALPHEASDLRPEDHPLLLLVGLGGPGAAGGTLGLS